MRRPKHSPSNGKNAGNQTDGVIIVKDIVTTKEWRAIGLIDEGANDRMR
jgi:hypothetical protein